MKFEGVFSHKTAEAVIRTMLDSGVTCLEAHSQRERVLLRFKNGKVLVIKADQDDEGTSELILEFV